MNITFLIGNGFDLNCGLKSSYKDVYNGYCKINETDSELIKNFKKDCETWSAFEMSMAENVNKFQSEQEFIECLRHFEEYLKSYLKEEESLFEKKFQASETLSKIEREIERSISAFYKDITPNITNNINNQIEVSNVVKYNFIVFNYTEVLNRMIMLSDIDLEEELEIIYIHGSLKGGDPVLGIDNEKQLKLEHFDFSDAGRLHFIKPFFNNEYDAGRVNKAKKAILESNVLCVYGMSLGESDLTWKKLIMQWLDPPLSNRHLFIYDYNAICNYKNIIENGASKADLLLEERNAKRKYLKEKLNIQKEHVNYEKYFQEIHMPFKNIFNIKEIIETANSKNKDVINKLKEDIENIKLNL